MNLNSIPFKRTSDAVALFRSAYENRYTWDSSFPGFKAVARFTQNGREHQAQIQVTAELKIVISNASSNDAVAALRDQLQEIITHRMRRRFEDVHGKNEFTCGETDATGAVTILVSGAAMGDRYKVCDNIVTLVHRHIQGTIVTINVLSTLNTGEGYLPVDYESCYSTTSGNQPDSLIQKHHDEYDRFGDYFLLTSRQIVQAGKGNAPQTQELRLTEICLLNR